MSPWPTNFLTTTLSQNIMNAVRGSLLNVHILYEHKQDIIQIIIATNNISLLFLFSEEMRSIAFSPHLMVASKMSISATKREIFSLRLQPKLGVQTVHSSQCCECFFIFLSIANVWLRAKSKCFTSSRLRCLQLILRYIHTASNRSILSKLLSNFL